MIFKKMPKNIKTFILVIVTFLSASSLCAETTEFKLWLDKFKKKQCS